MSTTPNIQRARWFGWAALFTLLLFIANLVYGTWQLAQGASLSAPLDGVPEFLLLLLAVALFVTYTLLRSGGRPPPTER